MKKIALIIPMLQPYRVSLYQKLIESTSEKFNWCIFHGEKKIDDARPAFNGATRFKHIPFVSSFRKIGPLTVVFQSNLFKEIKKFDPDIIIINANAGELGNRRISYWAKRNSKKLILWVCSYDSGEATGLSRALKRLLMRVYYKRGDRFIAYSSHAKTLIESFAISNSKIEIAYNGLDILPLKRIEENVINEAKRLRAEHLNHKNNIVFLFVGGLTSMKKPILLIDSFLNLCREQNNIQLWIIGDGPMQEEVLHCVKNNSNSIKYFGRIEEGVDPYFFAADWFVLPGAGGLALNQAMFWKTPCIVSNADGTEEDLVFDNINGYRFNNGDSFSLSDALKRAILTDPAKYSQMQTFSRYLVEVRSNTDTMFKAFIHAIES